MTKLKRKSLDEIGYLCYECAVNLDLRWPKGHCATTHESKCEVCEQDKSLTSITDWLKPKEKELKSWD
jgi:hypothetical protein